MHFHRTLLDENFRVEGRKTWFETVQEMQSVLDEYLIGYNERRPHQGCGMKARTPAQAFVEGLFDTAPASIAEAPPSAHVPKPKCKEKSKALRWVSAPLSECRQGSAV